MVDVNKYLENQIALAKQRNEFKIHSVKNKISAKSTSAGLGIAKMQNKKLLKNNIVQNVMKSSGKLSVSETWVSDSEELQSEDEEDDISIHIVGSSTSRAKLDLKRIIDDGDTTVYNKRISNWQNNLTAAKLKKIDGNSYSADIQYVLTENGDPDKNHKLENDLIIPEYIWKQLYKYQKTGVKWLWKLHQLKSGGMLGDEMGLGKTVQIIAFLAGLYKTNTSWGSLGPSIIVAPATVIYQWVLHFHFWCPSIRVAVLHHSGSYIGNHKKLISDIHTSNGILLITYAGIVKYTKDLIPKKWQYLVLDEGHKIRNLETQVSKLVKKFQTPHKLLITGSPMQNNLQELWSLFDFMRPGLLGTYNAFMKHVAVPITQGGYANATELQEATALEIAKTLKNMIKPYMLRRTKDEVQDHIKLPEKKEQVLFCALTKEQIDLYMGYLMSGIVKSILDRNYKYKSPSRARVLVALLTLRKICNHPDLYLNEAEKNSDKINIGPFGNWKRSGKMSVVHSLLTIWQKQGHRTLIFSQSRAMICILERHLQTHDFKYLKMDGTVNVCQRQNLIKTFNENTKYLVFLATTRVGSLGVNLTGADRVIIYDPDWNPATDNQAKERAWRIGQKRNVTVYRLLSAGTIEEKIYQRQIFKNSISNKILLDTNEKSVLSTSTLQGLFTLEQLYCETDTETTSLFKHTKINAINEDEDAKKNREIIINPNPLTEEPEINLVDKKSPRGSLENTLSEIEIINKHAKADYEENVVKKVLNSLRADKDDKINNKTMQKTKYLQMKSTKCDAIPKHNAVKDDTPNTVKDKVKHRKRKHSASPIPEIDNLLNVKKVKIKMQKREKGKNVEGDDYVLSKLFAKSAVKNALQHDVVMGLAQKERKYIIHREAAENANKAFRAIEMSLK